MEPRVIPLPKTLNWIGDRQADLAYGPPPVSRTGIQVAMLTKLHGPDHWLVTSARLDLNDIDILEKLTPDQRQSLRQALDELNQVGKFNIAREIPGRRKTSPTCRRRGKIVIRRSA